jgi:hypothetical protein
VQINKTEVNPHVQTGTTKLFTFRTRGIRINHNRLSTNYFTVSLMLYVTKNIYIFQTAACFAKLNGFTSCNAEQHIRKGFKEIPSKKKVVETGHIFCEVILQNGI